MVFFKTRLPVEPVSFIQKICQDTADGAQPKNCRFVKRLTPMTAIEKATARGLEAVAKQVLAPHFHGPDQAGKKVSFAMLCTCNEMTHPSRTYGIANGVECQKFAIRPSIRNNKEFTRDQIIKTVAAAVGPGHKVDLHGYDHLILVEIYQVRLFNTGHVFLHPVCITARS